MSRSRCDRDQKLNRWKIGSGNVKTTTISHAFFSNLMTIYRKHSRDLYVYIAAIETILSIEM